MRVPMIEMRAFEGKRWRLCLLPVIRFRIPMSYFTPWLDGIQAVGSSPVFRFPNACPCESKFCTLHRLLIAPVAPNAQKLV